MKNQRINQENKNQILNHLVDQRNLMMIQLHPCQIIWAMQLWT